MELKNIDLEEFAELYNDSFTPKRKVDKEEVRYIVSNFLYRGAFIMEVLIGEKIRMNAEPSSRLSEILSARITSRQQSTKEVEESFCGTILCHFA